MIAAVTCALLALALPVVTHAATPPSSKLRGITPDGASAWSAQEIRHLPGYHNDFLSKHYSGYITVNHHTKRRLWYWLATSERSERSERSETQQPVVLWLTGGPGCSSLDAFVYENGPFKLHFDDKEEDSSDNRHHRRKVAVRDNDYSWSKAATMVYVDSPAGTGMSLSDDPRDYHTNDTRTVEDLVVFVHHLLQEFPEYADNEFYIAGESYAGVYIPLLAKALLKANKMLGEGGRRPPVNLKGYLIGNGVTDDEFDGNGGVDFAYGHSLISSSQLQDLRSACGGSYWNASRGSECAHLLRRMEHGWGNLNIYDIGSPCTLNGGATDMEDLDGSTSGRRSWPLGASLPNGEAVKNWGHLLKHVIPCADRRAALAWFNDEEVREAIHAAPKEELREWAPCSDDLYYHHDSGSMIPVHLHNLKHGLRVLVYSGDMDYVVPFTASRAWVDSLGLEEERSWQPWTIDKQVAGFHVRYRNGLSFATVKGAGHMVPQCKPDVGLELFRRFLNDEM